MTTIVTRAGKGSPLTHTEVDTNFTNLNTAKLETAAIPLGTLGAPSISFLSYSTTGIYSPAGDELGVSMLGSDKIRIKSTGEIIINATASRTTLGITPRLQIEGSASSSQCSMSLTGAGAGSSLIPRLYLSKARSSVNAVVLEDDILGFILFNGGDGSSLVNAGFIKAEVDGTPSAGIVPGRLVFATVDTAGGSGERMIIKNNGNVSIDGTTFNVDAVNNRVGIGATPTGAKLSSTTSDVGGTIGDTTQLAVVNANGAVGDFAGIRFNYFNDGNGGGKFAYIGSVLTSQASNGSADIVFGTRPTSTTTISERARIRSDGMFEVKGAGVSGSSPAFSVSGSAPANSAIIDTSGRLLIGTTNTIAGATDSLLQIRGNSSGTQFAGKVALATEVAVASIVSGTDLGAIYFGNTANGVGGLIECKGDAQWSTAGGGDYPGRLVFSTTADGGSSPTERMRITNAGYMRSSANAASPLNYGHEFTDNADSTITLTINQRSSTYAQAGGGMLFLNCVKAANSDYTFLGAYSGDVADREFNLRGDGNAFADGTFTGGGADYAEYFEWCDNNPDAEDRRGISVVLDGDKIRKAVAGEDPIGVISGNPSVVGDAAWNKWSGKYLRDEFGTYIKEDYEVTDEDGNTVTQQRRKLNPAYDTEAEYIPREQRPEWDCVGLMGKLRIRKGQATGSRWIKMRDINTSVEEWLVR